MSTLFTKENAPRDINDLRKMSRAVRYRLAAQLGLFTAGGEDAERAFMGSDDEFQATQVLAALEAYHANPQAATAAAMTPPGAQPPPTYAQAPTPMQQPPPGYQAPPGYGAPPPAAGQQTWQPPQPPAATPPTTGWQPPPGGGYQPPQTAAPPPAAPPAAAPPGGWQAPPSGYGAPPGAAAPPPGYAAPPGAAAPPPANYAPPGGYGQPPPGATPPGGYQPPPGTAMPPQAGPPGVAQPPRTPATASDPNNQGAVLTKYLQAVEGLTRELTANSQMLASVVSMLEVQFVILTIIAENGGIRREDLAKFVAVERQQIVKLLTGK